MPDPEAEVVVACGCGVLGGFVIIGDGGGGGEGGVVFVFGFGFEGGGDEAAGYEVPGHGEELPVRVDAGGAAEFPGDGAEGAVAGGGEEGVQRAAVALHFVVGGGFGFRGVDGGEGGGVGEGDDEHVGGEGEGGVGGAGAEGSLCGGDVGVFGDGGDEVGCEVRVREAEKAFLRSGWGGFVVTGSLVGVVVGLVAAVVSEA